MFHTNGLQTMSNEDIFLWPGVRLVIAIQGNTRVNISIIYEHEMLYLLMKIHGINQPSK